MSEAKRMKQIYALYEAKVRVSMALAVLLPVKLLLDTGAAPFLAHDHFRTLKSLLEAMVAELNLLLDERKVR